MAHGERAQRNGSRGKEYWASRLHRYGEQPGRLTKMLTHRHERRIGNREAKQLIVEAEEERLDNGIIRLEHLIADSWDDLLHPYP